MSATSPALGRLPAIALVLLLTACTGGKSSPETGSTMPASGQAMATNCPKPAKASFSWPAGIPANFPKPPGGRVVSSRTGENGLRIVRLDTPFALREGILFVLKELPKAGYRLGRGDAEAREADAPFQSGDLRGVVRLVSTGNTCETTWLVAVVRAGAGGGPSLTPFPRPSSSASLPFG